MIEASKKYSDLRLPVHYYQSPNGQHYLIQCGNVYDEDLNYFLNHDIKVSMEILNGDYVVYGCPEEDESEESEVIVFSRGRSCADTLTELALICRATFGARYE